MRRWLVPDLLSAIVLLAQVAPRPPLIDAATGAPALGVHLSFPALHVMLAPLTLLAGWLNGGSTADLKGFGIWAVILYVLVRVAMRPRPADRGPARSRLTTEAMSAVLFIAGVVLFLAWAVWSPRPIARLVADTPDALIWDAHSHTAASHDGRRRFDAAHSSAWHARAGFDAAFITDHNTAGAEAAVPVAQRPARLLGGEELSLFGLHLVVLGVRETIANEPALGSWDSTGALVRRLAADTGLLLVASLPEYWRYHWDDVGTMVEWGVQGWEVWTTSPRAMEFPPPRRRQLVARAGLERLILVGATDMHGLGYSATVWNVATVPGWRTLNDSALTTALIDGLRSGVVTNQVVARNRWMPSSARLDRAIAVPVGLVQMLRQVGHAHTAALLAWIWGVWALSGRRARPTR